MLNITVLAGRPVINAIAILTLSTMLGASVGTVTVSWRQPASVKSIQTTIEGDGIVGPRGMMWIPGGEFIMGSSDFRSPANERPAHKVRVHGFWIDRTPVTNAAFASFVQTTGYITTAERPPQWNTLRMQLPPGTPKPSDEELVPGAMTFVGTSEVVDLRDYTQWWRYTPGANWRHPQGPESSIIGKDNYPVVQVSYEDALAFARWSGKRLPTEAEWEFAARGGLEGAIYAWGNKLAPQGRKMANIWEQSAHPFPVVSPYESHGTTAVCSFPQNGYGLCDIIGNVWQWVADWYRADAYARGLQTSEIVDPLGPDQSYDPDEFGTPADAPKRVIRGGSFLCSPSYCRSYRPSARRGSDPYTSMSHIGFRLAADLSPHH